MAEEAGFLAVTGPCNFVFPRDHGAHPGYRTEWWYYTGHLKAGDGRRFGFQLTFFRSQLAPSADRENWPRQHSAWRTDQVYLAHAALTDVAAGKHMAAEKTARAAVGLAGATVEEHHTTVHLGPWKTQISDQGHRLAANGDAFVLDLTLVPRKAPVSHGDGGYSRKGSAPQRASCYYSLTRLEAEGQLTVDKEKISVSGLAWMDHEYSTAPLEPGLTGWDWFSLQFEDGSELMVYGLRQADGSWHPASSGTLVAADGVARHLGRDAIRLDVTRRWKSPHSGAVYPAGWRLQVDTVGLALTIRPVLKDQEMRTLESTGVTYWEGLVDVAGRRRDREIEGHGYAELTGYAKAFDAPL